MKSALRSSGGAFDLPSIIAGVVAVAILAAGVFAAVFVVIPFSQDNGARQDLSAVRTAEGVAKAKDGRFMDSAGLRAAEYLSAPTSLGILTDASGSCYVAITKSGSGASFYATDAVTDPKLLTSGTDTGCIGVSEQQALATAVGAKPASAAPIAPPVVLAPFVNGGFESGLDGWTTGGAGVPVSSTAEVHGGKKSALITVPDGGNSTLAQTIGIPTTGTTIVSAWYRNNCPIATCTTTLQARSDTGAVLATLGTVTNTTNIWTEIWADLTPYLGSNIQLYIENKSLAAGSSSSKTYFDDITLATTAASAPSKVVAWTNDSSATVQWTPSVGAAAVTSYTVTPYLGAVAQPTVTVSGAPAPSTALVTGLANGSAYTFKVAATNPLGTSPQSGASPAYTVNPNAVANGGFEAGLTGWTTGGAGAPVSSTAEAHGGTRSALITAPAGGNSTLAQTIGIPAAGTTTVSSWYRNNCNTTNCSITMQARSTDGVVLATLGTVTNATNAWTEIMADLTPYKGTSIQLVIENKSLAAGSGGSITYIDDISVTAK